ncbi:putative bifunctional diguanylate cyclase/phosphodiesterase [Shewanella acanthi]|uniref:putative bifunctional diguanylate cyclase/phosphodiesterase n=1 Tax=Shewanella acanthi TaxID=2864212 RepID=UPI001C65E397|nr:GGDEF domain-containing phosphodiesterase [Shewanella acanthi]QYJ78241.1 EAL domain-containing protein [Shewanella acanthi]
MGLKLTNTEIYRDELLAYLEPTMNRMMLIGAFGAFISFINTLIIRPDAWVHVFFTSATFFLLISLFLLRRRVSADMKISTVTAFLTLYSSVLLLTDNELAGILLVFLNAVIIVFLQKPKSQWLLLSLTTVVVIVSFFRSAAGDISALSNYAYSLAIYLVLISIMPIAFRAIYFFLYNKLELLQLKLKEEEQTTELLQQKTDEIELLAYFDRLTGLYNRYRLSHLINQQLSQRHCKALVFIDIKNFRKINSLYGLKHADAILSNIAGLIQKQVQLGLIGYLGANTFVVSTQKKVSQNEYLQKVKALQADINQAANLALNLELYSLCLLPEDDALKAEDYYKLAEDHLAAMKAQGITSKYVDEAEKQALQADAERKQFILESINNHSYEIHYQEKYNVVTKQVVGIEALARLQRDGQFISPGIFIPIVEADEHIISFGYLILELVCRQFNQITDLYGPIPVSVNLSPKQLADKDIVSNIRATLAHYQIDPSRLELEITENELIGNFTEFNQVITELKHLGIKFSIDDFGTGYSSLGYLSVLPADVLKIDKSFIDTIHTDTKQQAIVRAILDIAGISGMEIVAEGVETTDQLDALQQLGVDVIQGYLYSRPQPLDKVDTQTQAKLSSDGAASA